MATWAELERAEASMASRARELLGRHQVAYLATVRHNDGGPRVHQVCPCISGDRLYLAIGAQSPKLRDLRRDGRYMLHFMCGEEDEEFNVRGTASELTDSDERSAVRASAAAQGIAYTEEEVLFRLDIARADATRWNNFGSPDIQPLRHRWVERQSP
jgi:hypothetical protein